MTQATPTARKTAEQIADEIAARRSLVDPGVQVWTGLDDTTRKIIRTAALLGARAGQ